MGGGQDHQGRGRLALNLYAQGRFMATAVCGSISSPVSARTWRMVVLVSASSTA